MAADAETPDYPPEVYENQPAGAQTEPAAAPESEPTTALQEPTTVPQTEKVEQFEEEDHFVDP